MTYLVEVATYEWGNRKAEYRISASNPSTAAARALRQYQKEKVAGKHRVGTWHIRVTKV